ncbi:MAG: sulfatase [Planctomycetota bacterium]
MEILRSTATALFFAFAALTISQADGNDKPNFVIIIADDHGINHSAPYGQPEYKTPNMQRMADEGIRLTNAYVAAPTCGPSRAALCTGMMPCRNGIKANHEKKLNSGVESLLPQLAAQGYDIVFRGKIAHGGNQPYVTDDVTKIRGSIRRNFTLDGVEEYFQKRTDRKRPVALFIGCTFTHRAWPDASEARMQPSEVTVPAKTFDTPKTRIEMTRYAEAVERTDRLIGEVRELVAKHLPVDNTLTLYTSDHGQSWPFGKWSLYEAGIRTPMIAVWPGKVPEGVTNDAMVSWVDLLPTLIDLAGGELPSDIDGQSFSRVLLNQTSEHRNHIFAMHNGSKGDGAYPIRSVRVGNWKYIRNLHPEFYYSTALDVVRKRGKSKCPNWPSWIEAAKTNVEAATFLRAYHSRPAEELYRLDRDSNETTNLAMQTEYSEKLAELREIVSERMKRVKDAGTVTGQPRLLKNVELPTAKTRAK